MANQNIPEVEALKAHCTFMARDSALELEKKPEEAELFKKAGVTGKISDIKGTVRFEQANENANVTVSFEKFEGITKKHGLHIHTFSNFQASGKHLGGKKIPYNDGNYDQHGNLQMNFGKSAVGHNKLYHAGAVGGLIIDNAGKGTIVQADGKTYAPTVTLPNKVVSLFKCEGMMSTCSQILGRSMIIHRDEDDLGVARGLFNEFKLKLGDPIQGYPGRTVTCSGASCSPPVVGCKIMDTENPGNTPDWTIENVLGGPETFNVPKDVKDLKEKLIKKRLEAKMGQKMDEGPKVAMCKFAPRNSALALEKTPEGAALIKQSGVTGKISDIKAYVKFEQASKTSPIKVSFGKFEGITKKHGLHIHTYSDFQASGKHLGGKKIPYDKGTYDQHGNLQMNYGKSAVGKNHLYHAGAIGGLIIDENGKGTIVQEDGKTYAETVMLPHQVVNLWDCDKMDDTCSTILGRAMIIHRDEDDLGVARGLFNEFRIKLGEMIPGYPGRKVTCSGSKCSPPLVGCTIMYEDEKMNNMVPVWDKTSILGYDIKNKEQLEEFREELEEELEDLKEEFPELFNSGNNLSPPKFIIPIFVSVIFVLRNFF